MDTDQTFREYLKGPSARRLGRVVKVLHGLVWATALRMTGNAQDAEDITQDVFLDLLLHPPPPESVASVRGYIVWKVLGRATNLRRAERRREERERKGAEVAREEGLAVDDADALRSAVAELPADLRTAVELRYFGGLTNRETAAALDVSEGTVEKRLHRAREALRSRLAHLAGVTILLDSDYRWTVAAAPPALLGSLLGIAARGSVLSFTRATAGSGALWTAKKMALGATFLAVCGIGILGWKWMETHSRIGESPSPAVMLRVEGAPAGKSVAADAASETPPAEARYLAPVLASIHGRLFDIEDRPLQNAEILALAEISAEEARRLQDLGFSRVSPGSLTVKATSNEHGNFAISGALPTSWHVYVYGDAHVGCWPPIVRLEPGEDKEVSPQLCMTYALSGTISDATTGTPIRDAQVLLGGDAASHMLEARIEDGVFSFPADTAGRYAIGEGIVVSRARDTDPLGVVASAPGYAAKLELVRGEKFVDRQAGLDFALEPEYRALVRVRDPAGQPVEGVQFWVDNYELFFAWRGWRTDASGRAVIGHLSPKRYRIGLRHDAFHSREVILEEGRPREVDLDVVLEPKSGIIRGNIVFDERFPEGSRLVHTVTVWFDELKSDGRRHRHYAECDEKACTFSFQPPRSGIYRPGHVVGSRGETAGEPFSHDGKKDLQADDVVVSLDPPYVAGKVVLASTQEVMSDLEVRVAASWEGQDDPWAHWKGVNGFRFPLNRDAALPSVRTDKDGRFLVQLPGRVHRRDAKPFRVTVHAGSPEKGWAQARALDCDDDTVVDDLLLELEPPGTIEGRVLGLNGETVRKEVVAVWNGETVKHAVTGDDGTYSIPGLPAGDYAVLPVGREEFRPFGAGLGPSGPLPSPLDFFSFPFRLEKGSTLRVDLDLERDSLGRIEVVIPDSLAPHWIFYGMLVGDRVTRRACLGGQEPLRSGRPNGALFDIREHLLLPGTYRVWLEDGEKRRLSETSLLVGNAETIKAPFPTSEATFTLPIVLPPETDESGVEVLRLSALDPHAPDASDPWVDWGGYKVAREPGMIRLEGVPSLRTRALLRAPGCAEAWSEEVDLARGDGTAKPLRFERPSAAVELSPPLQDHRSP